MSESKVSSHDRDPREAVFVDHSFLPFQSAQMLSVSRDINIQLTEKSNGLDMIIYSNWANHSISSRPRRNNSRSRRSALVSDSYQWSWSDLFSHPFCVPNGRRMESSNWISRTLLGKKKSGRECPSFPITRNIDDWTSLRERSIDLKNKGEVKQGRAEKAGELVSLYRNISSSWLIHDCTC
jgi:hypothetical protein